MLNKSHKFVINEYNLKTAEKDVYYGKIEGYYSFFHFQEALKKIVLMIGVTVGDNGDIRLRLEDLVSEKVIKSFEILPHKIVATFADDFFSSKLTDRIKSFTENIYPALRNGGFETGCFVTGMDDVTVKFRKIGQDYAYISARGANIAVENLESKKIEISEKSENVLLGILGAIIGAALGGFVWMLLGIAGYYVWIAGIATVFLAFKGYEKLGGKVSKLSSVLVYLISIAMLVIANIMEWAWQMYKVFSVDYDVTFFDVLKESLNIIFGDPGLKKDFIIDLAIGVGVVMIIGAIIMGGLYRESSGQYEVKEFE